MHNNFYLNEKKNAIWHIYFSFIIGFLVVGWDFTVLGLNILLGPGATALDIALYFYFFALLFYVILHKETKIHVIVFMFFLIILYLLIQFLITSNLLTDYPQEDIVRFVQFLTRFSMILLFVSLFQLIKGFKSNLLKSVVIISWVVVSIGFAILAMKTLGISIGFLDYLRGRQGLFLPQATSVFYEPAAYGQFLVFVLFALFLPSERIKQNFKLFLLVFASIVLTQSLGAFIGLLVYAVTAISSKFLISRKSLNKAEMAAILVSAALIITILTTDDTRVSSAFSNDEISQRSGSSQARLWGELDILIHFLTTEPLPAVVFGLGDNESRFYREIIGHTATVSGNGFVEIALRYGLFFWLVTFYFFYKWINNYAGFCYFIIAFFIITQIDGAIVKPWTFYYLSILAIVYKKDTYIYNKA